MLESFTTLILFQFLLIFCRLGSCIMLMPGFGELSVPPTVRLIIAFLVTLVLLPMLKAGLPPPPTQVPGLFVLLASEIVIGIFIGAIARMMLSAMHITGMIIAFQSSLASALMFDATQGNQGSVVGIFMMTLGMTLLFITDFHHLMLEALVHSYQVFKVTDGAPLGDLAQTVSQVMADTFLVALKLAAPLVIIGILVYLIAGLMSRLMPSMQVFFVLVPVQLLASFYLLMMTLSAVMMWYINHMEDSFTELFSL